MSTPDFYTRTIGCATLAISLTALLACSPGGITGDGSSDSGDREGSESAGETGGGDGDPAAPEGEPICVEMVPGAVTCWVAWGAGTFARVLLACQAAAAVTAGVFGPGYEMELPEWGLVLCHKFASADGSVCLFDDDRVILTETIDGWVPDLSVLVGQHEPVAPPCSDAGP